MKHSPENKAVLANGSFFADRLIRAFEITQTPLTRQTKQRKPLSSRRKLLLT